MNIEDLKSVLQKAPHFDFIMFDACFMQSVEVAYELRDYCDYYIGFPAENPGATTTNLAEIREYGKNTNLITRRLTGQEWNDALVLMKTHQMIELPGAVANLEDFTPIYIYSTVNVFCSAMDINELVREYQNEMTE